MNVVLGDGGGVGANRSKKNPPKIFFKMIQQTMVASREYEGYKSVSLTLFPGRIYNGLLSRECT